RGVASVTDHDAAARAGGDRAGVLDRGLSVSVRRNASVASLHDMMPIQRLIFAAGLCATACVDTNLEVPQTEQDVVLPGYELVDMETTLDTMSTKQLQVECPKGKQALGVGWEGLDNTRAFTHAIATYSAPSY